MKVKVLGIQSVDYVSRKTGNPVKGLHYILRLRMRRWKVNLYPLFLSVTI